MLAGLFAQTSGLESNPDMSLGANATVLVMYLIVAIISVIAMWYLFKKAGRPGWAALIPFYSSYVLLKIAGRPGWWLILLFIPVVSVVASIFVGLDIGRRFGRSDAFGAIVCGLLGIGYIILGFNKDTYSPDGTGNQIEDTPYPTSNNSPKL